MDALIIGASGLLNLLYQPAGMIISLWPSEIIPGWGHPLSKLLSHALWGMLVALVYPKKEKAP
ncbi:hypothetical protein N9B94_03390 [Verrucomicrobia bacterium]|nr:hypothetical protein [Verrucomicrobiota bacterium]